MNGTTDNYLIPFVVGANHRSCGLSMRDRLFIEDPMVPEFLHRLRDQGLTQALVLSTCDRVEVQGVHEDPNSIIPVIQQALADHGEMDSAAFGDQLYGLTGGDALRHILRVASSLDSQVIGEPQVLGQVKAAHRMAREAGTLGGAFETILQDAYNTAKRVRSETAIGERAVSIAAAAVQLARDVQGDLEKCRALLVGDAEMGEMVAAQLLSAGIDVLSVMNDRTPQRARDAARRLDCHAAPWENLSGELEKSDILIMALGRRQYTINSDMIHSALAGHRRKLMYIIDLALPGDVDPAVNRIDAAFLYDLGDLERVAMEGMSHREGEARHAEDIIDQALTSIGRDTAERAAVPVLSRLRAHVEGLRDLALNDAGGDAEKATRLLANRLLHDPSVVLRHIALNQDDGELEAAEHMIEYLFGLDNKTHNGDK